MPLHLLAALFANSKVFLKAYFIDILFLNDSFLFQNSPLLLQKLCRHVFSQNCRFVANLVDKALVDDSTNM